MSNKTRLQTNNTNLQALIDKANTLPDAGSGGSGGGSVETCTVTVTHSSNIFRCGVTRLVDGTISCEVLAGDMMAISPTIINDVVVGSVLSLMMLGDEFITVTNGSLISEAFMPTFDGDMCVLWYAIS